MIDGSNQQLSISRVALGTMAGCPSKGVQRFATLMQQSCKVVALIYVSYLLSMF